MTVEDTGSRNLREDHFLPKVPVRPPAPAPTHPLKARGACHRTAPPDRDRPCRQRSCESRFFSMLTDEQMRTAELIALGFQFRTSGIGMRTQTFSTLPPSTGNIEERQSELVRRFMCWAVATQKQGISVAAVLDIIVFGKSCRAVDRERRKRNGFARSQLIGSLDLYNKI
ncbi:MAG: hypothetical protein WDZ54_01700 [Sneathiella sp.]